MFQNLYSKAFTNKICKYNFNGSIKNLIEFIILIVGHSDFAHWRLCQNQTNVIYATLQFDTLHF
jgi:hypothetical protein